MKQWNEKMTVLQEQGYDKKKLIVCGSSVSKSIVKYFEGNFQYIPSKAKWQELNDSGEC